jgi:hypothetical protein
MSYAPASYRRRRLSPQEKQQRAREALQAIQNNPSMANFGQVIEAFAARGFDPCDIDPKVNVLTYAAWTALGRQVRRGEKSVKVTTWHPIEDRNAAPAAPGARPSVKMRPVTACLFHISQTDAIAPRT